MRTAALTIVAAALTVVPGAGASGGTTVSNCGRLVQQPASLVLTCGDANYSLIRLRWRSWGRTAASARGVARANTCTPNCAAGSFRSYAADVTADRLTQCKGSRIYLRLTIRYPGARPEGFPATDRFTFTCATAVR